MRAASPRNLLTTALLTTLALAAPARADDCDEKWLTDLAPSNVPTVYTTTLWDPDGQGPMSVQLVAGGIGLEVGGRELFSPIARWDGTHWQPFRPTLVASTSARVDTVVVTPDGSLVVGGNFLYAGGPPDFVSGPARWTGSGWQSLGDPRISATTRRLAVLADGTLIGIGRLDTGSSPTTALSRWNGSVWQPLPSFINPFNTVDALLPDGNNLLVGGRITSNTVPGGEDFMRWNGPFPGAWSAFPAPGAIGPVSYIRSMTRLPNGDVVVAGRLNAEGTSLVSRWDGQTWTEMNAGLDGLQEISAIYTRADGTLYAGSGQPSQTPLVEAKLLTWTGSEWRTMATLGEGKTVLTLGAMPDGGVVAGGDFRTLTQNGVTLTTGGIIRLGVPIPVIDPYPIDAITCPRGAATFTIGIREPNNDTFQWQIRDDAAPTGWRSLQDGNADGFTFAGATTAQLTITPDDMYTAANLPEVRVLATNPCGTAASRSATIQMCPADWDCSGGVDGDDIAAFFNDWQQGRGDADMSGGTDGDDITAFFLVWQRGECLRRF